MSMYVYEAELLPAGFKFPARYLGMMTGQEEEPDLKPWGLLGWERENSLFWLETVKNWYPTRSLVPFAKDDSSDDIACFDGSDASGDPRVFYVHTFAEAPYEDRGSAKNFDEWLQEVKAIGVGE